MHGDAREAPRQEGTPALVELDELHGSEASSMEPESMSADAGEEVGDI